MTNFKEQDGMLFKMLEEPTPLTPDAEMPCLVRLIQDDSPMGKHNKDLHGFDPERLTPKICTEVVDINDLSDPNRGSARCDGFMSIQYYRYELIGTHAKAGTKEWALQMMNLGKCVCHVKAPSIKYHRPTHSHYVKRVVRENCTDDMSDAVWMEGADPTGWQIYEHEQPKPLLADAQVGDLCRRRDGKWVQIDRLLSIGGMPWICYEIGGLRYINNGEQLNSKLSELGIISTEPLAPEGTAEWAWQMLMLQKPVSHPAEGEFQDTYYTKEGFVRCMAKTGWQLYEPKQEPESQYKVGDWLEFIDAGGRKSQGKYLSKAYDNAILVLDITYNMRCVVPVTKIIRKLSPSEVVIHIGCLSGTVEDLSYAESGRFWLIGKATERCQQGMFVLLYDEMLDTPTSNLVESLLKAQEVKK